MTDKIKLKFRFASGSDVEVFHNSLLEEKNKIMRQLGITGMDWDHFAANNFKATFVAQLEKEHTIVGFAKVIGGDSCGFNYIGTFYVRPKFRKKGIGTQLFKFVEDYAKNNFNAEGINLHTIDNPPMEALVKKMGFKLSGVYKKDFCINGKFYNTSRWLKLYKK